jgi:hypothetical protein
MGDMCHKGLHPYIPENRIRRSDGRDECRLCKRERERIRKAQQRARENSGQPKPEKNTVEIDKREVATLRAGFNAWQRYQDRQEMTLGDERQEALFRLAYRHPQEFSEILEEVQGLASLS